MNTQSSNQPAGNGNVTRAKSSRAIVLVHGGFVDGSGWAGVYKILKDQGYNVRVVQNAPNPWRMTSPPRKPPLTVWTARSCSSAIRMAAS